MTTRNSTDDEVTTAETAPGTSRRRFLGYLLAAPTLVAAAEIGEAVVGAPAAHAAGIPSPDEPSDIEDLGDLQDQAAARTADLIKVQVNKDGTALFMLPRAEVGQGITTTFAMLIAEELDIAVHDVTIKLERANPALMSNQLTGGSNSVRSLYYPVRRAAAMARGRLVATAADHLGVSASKLRTQDGHVIAPDGRSVDYGSIAEAAAVTRTTPALAQLKPASKNNIVGKPHGRIDARDIVTGRKVFAMDMTVKDAMPAMVCRPPTLNGTVKRVRNRAEVLRLPGITHVVTIPTGVAVRGRTFGECIDAVRALKVTWGEGSIGKKSDEDVLHELHQTELPFGEPSSKEAGGTTISQRFTFHFNSNTALEPNSAVARVTKTSAEVWSSLKVPIVAQQKVAEAVGLKADQVVVHVIEGGGSFGRHLFPDVAVEAAIIAKKTGKPVKLMWHRTDEYRQGRVHPMATSNVRAIVKGKDVLSYVQRHTGVSTDFRHGFGDIVTAYAATFPGSNKLGYAETIFNLTANVSYNYGETEQSLTETDNDFNTGSMRNIYSPDVATAQELITDQIATQMGLDPYEFRLKYLKNDRSKNVLRIAAKRGKWGRKLPAHMAQGIAFHTEYKCVVACLVEIDCRPETIKRKIYDAFTGPRVTKVTFVADVGLPINPLGLQAQMMGGCMDGIALALTSSLHLREGHFLEGSWDNYWYTRQWNSPPDLDIHILPTTTGKPGGAGELGVAASKAAVACAYARATGTMPTRFPINHRHGLDFPVIPFDPSVPQSPTDGLDYKY